MASLMRARTNRPIMSSCPDSAVFTSVTPSTSGAWKYVRPAYRWLPRFSSISTG